jgi:hypothetical protein
MLSFYPFTANLNLLSGHASYIQEYFYDRMFQNAILEVLSQDTSQNGITEPFLPGIGVTSNLLHQILGHSLCSGTFFKRKCIYIYIYIYIYTHTHTHTHINFYIQKFT